MDKQLTLASKDKRLTSAATTRYEYMFRFLYPQKGKRPLLQRQDGAEQGLVEAVVAFAHISCISYGVTTKPEQMVAGLRNRVPFRAVPNCAPFLIFQPCIQ